MQEGCLPYPSSHRSPHQHMQCKCEQSARGCLSSMWQFVMDRSRVELALYFCEVPVACFVSADIPPSFLRCSGKSCQAGVREISQLFLCATDLEGRKWLWAFS